MKYKLTFLSFALLIYGCRSQGPTECTIHYGGLNWGANIIIPPKNIYDTEQLNLVMPFTGNVGVSTPFDTDTGSRYIEASINSADSTIVIKTNEYFNQYFDEDTPTTDAEFTSISRTIVITCEGIDYPLALAQAVVDTNNKVPTFSVKTYDYSIPMPLMPGVDLTTFGTVLSVKDLDFSPQTIVFSVDRSESFTVETRSLGNKEYQAVLKAKSYARYDAGLTLTITASDGTNEDTATITITKDDSLSLPYVPTFSEPFYEYTYSEDGGTPTITPVDPSKQILVTSSDLAATIVTISNATYVTVRYDGTTGIVTIASSGTAIPPTSEQVLNLALTVTLNGQSSQCAIVVALPNEIVCSALTFNQPYYTATYSTDTENHIVLLDPGQTIGINENLADVQFSVDGDDHFDIFNTGGIWILIVVSNLDPSVLAQGSDIILTLKATITENFQAYEGLGIVVVKLPPVLEVPSFTQGTYEGTYMVATDGGKDTVNLTNGPINTVQTYETVDITIVNTYSSFGLTQDADGWTVVVTTNLAPTVLQNGGQIFLQLQAKVTTGSVSDGSSTLVINLPIPVQVL